MKALAEFAKLDIDKLSLSCLMQNAPFMMAMLEPLEDMLDSFDTNEMVANQMKLDMDYIKEAKATYGDEFAARTQKELDENIVCRMRKLQFFGNNKKEVEKIKKALEMLNCDEACMEEKKKKQEEAKEKKSASDEKKSEEKETEEDDEKSKEEKEKEKKAMKEKEEEAYMEKKMMAKMAEMTDKEKEEMKKEYTEELAMMEDVGTDDKKMCKVVKKQKTEKEAKMKKMMAEKAKKEKEGKEEMSDEEKEKKMKMAEKMKACMKAGPSAKSEPPYCIFIEQYDGDKYLYQFALYSAQAMDPTVSAAVKEEIRAAIAKEAKGFVETGLEVIKRET